MLVGTFPGVRSPIRNKVVVTGPSRVEPHLALPSDCTQPLCSLRRGGHCKNSQGRGEIQAKAGARLPDASRIAKLRCPWALGLHSANCKSFGKQLDTVEMRQTVATCQHEVVLKVSFMPRGAFTTSCTDDSRKKRKSRPKFASICGSSAWRGVGLLGHEQIRFP